MRREGNWAIQADAKLGKDDAKLITFTFDASVSLDEVSRFILDFRKK